ncbi:MAG: hypothetical protein ACREBW_10400, partial [Candidatus Micrarchaeaceae archaeon]
MSQERYLIENLFQITDKRGEQVPFIFNSYQVELDETWSGRDVIPKARRLGMTTYVLARYLARCLSHSNRTAVVISHDADATSRLLDKVHFMLDTSKVKAVTDRDNRNEIRFPKTNSQIYIGTAGTRNFGRGDTITDLLCSEIGSWIDPTKLMRALLQAASHGEVCIESTGDRAGSYYHRLCLRALEDQSEWKLHFFNWLNDPDCSRNFNSDTEREEFLSKLDPLLDEIRLSKEGLTPEHLHWRRGKILDE